MKVKEKVEFIFKKSQRIGWKMIFLLTGGDILEIELNERAGQIVIFSLLSKFRKSILCITNVYSSYIIVLNSEVSLQPS